MRNYCAKCFWHDVSTTCPFILFLPVYIYHHNKDKNAPSRNFLAVILLLIYIAVFSVFLALSVSKDILSSLVLTGNEIINSNKSVSIYVKDHKLENENFIVIRKSMLM